MQEAMRSFEARLKLQFSVFRINFWALKCLLAETKLPLQIKFIRSELNLLEGSAPFLFKTQNTQEKC